jgi:hypothetical protein
LRRPGLPTASLSRLQYDGSTASEPSVRRHQWEREKKKNVSPPPRNTAVGLPGRRRAGEPSAFGGRFLQKKRAVGGAADSSRAAGWAAAHAFPRRARVALPSTMRRRGAAVPHLFVSRA